MHTLYKKIELCFYVFIMAIWILLFFDGYSYYIKLLSAIIQLTKHLGLRTGCPGLRVHV